MINLIIRDLDSVYNCIKDSMMRTIILIISIVQSFTQPAITPPARVPVAQKFNRPLHLYNHYTNPMPNTQLTLCGNGILNTKEDYVAINVLGNAVDEECDDGNRRDGDGCSADCMDVDSMVSPCRVPTGTNIKYISMDGVTGSLYWVTGDNQIQKMDVSASGVSATTVTSQLVDSMMVYNATIYRYYNNQLVYNGKSIQAPFGLWVTLSKEPIFVIRESAYIRAVNCVKDIVLSVSYSGPDFDTCVATDTGGAAITCRGPNGVYTFAITVKMEDNTYSFASMTVAYRAYFGAVTNGTLLDQWTNALLRFKEGRLMEFPLPRKSMSNIVDSRVARIKSIMLSTTAFAVSKSNIRSLLSPSTPDAFYTTEWQGIGDRSVINVLRNTDPRCFEGEPCYLNVSTPMFTTMPMVVQHPFTMAFFILIEQMVWYVGRRGTRITIDTNWCLPYELKACPVGQWGNIDRACAPCPNPLPPNASNAERIQCAYSAPTNRRRLLATNTLTVRAVIVGPSDALLTTTFPAFSGETVTVRNGEVRIVTTNAAGALQRLNTAIYTNSWQTTTNPEVIYEGPTNSSSSDSGMSTTLIIVIALLAVAFVLGLCGLGYYNNWWTTWWTAGSVTSGGRYAVLDVRLLHEAGDSY